MTQTRRLGVFDIRDKEVLRDILNKEFPKPCHTLKELFNVHHYGSFYRDNLIGILLTNLFVEAHIEYIVLAEELLKIGVPFPTPRQNVAHFKTCSEYWKYLVHSPRDLFIALHQCPHLINMPDEKNKTLLHHALASFPKLGEQGIKIILFILLRTPNIDFALQDKDGNTALHLAAKHYQHPIVSQFIYPRLKEYFDHSLKNNEGKTIPQIRFENTPPLSIKALIFHAREGASIPAQAHRRQLKHILPQVTA